jgi:hypothetical protein
MTRINSLLDAIIKVTIPEDQCTNFLLWLLKKLPSRVLLEICNVAGLSITQVEEEFSFEVQRLLLSDSRPDGIIRFFNAGHLIIETKRFQNEFDKNQFTRHLRGGRKEFGENNIWLMLLSGDQYPPPELERLRSQYPGKIGFLSWKSLFQILENSKKILGERYQIVIEEFITFARHNAIEGVIAMNNDEFRKFIEAYPLVEKYEKAVVDKFGRILHSIKDRVIVGSEELVEENKDENNTKALPCLHICLEIDGWHTENSAFIFCNIIQQNIGAILTGYENRRARAKFLAKWEEKWKQIYKGNPKLSSFTWVEKGEDEYAIENGYFKLVEGTSGRSFNPQQLSAFNDSFYWGFAYQFDLDSLKVLEINIAKDFRNLLGAFLPRLGTKRAKRARKS